MPKKNYLVRIPNEKQAAFEGLLDSLHLERDHPGDLVAMLIDLACEPSSREFLEERRVGLMKVFALREDLRNLLGSHRRAKKEARREHAEGGGEGD